MATIDERIQKLYEKKHAKMNAIDNRYEEFLNDLAEFIVYKLENGDRLEDVKIFIPQGTLSRFLNNSVIRIETIHEDLNKKFDGKIIVDSILVGLWCEVTVSVT